MITETISQGLISYVVWGCTWGLYQLPIATIFLWILFWTIEGLSFFRSFILAASAMIVTYGVFGICMLAMFFLQSRLTDMAGNQPFESWRTPFSGIFVTLCLSVASQLLFFFFLHRSVRIRVDHAMILLTSAHIASAVIVSKMCCF